MIRRPPRSARLPDATLFRTAVICTAQDQCHDAGTCDPSTGLCSNPPKPDGTACDDSDACTTSEARRVGTGGRARGALCTSQDQCHEGGTCDPSTGLCSNPPKPDGTACDDAEACTTGDACQAGTCVSGTAVICTAQDQCHDAGTCDPSTGLCSNLPKPDGTTCDDSDACTTGDACQAGACIGGTAVICTAQDQCHDAVLYDSAAGLCLHSPPPGRSACVDSDACTTGDACQAGACVGGTAVICTAQDQCHDAGICDPATEIGRASCRERV